MADLGSLTARIGLDTSQLAVGVAAARGELAALNSSGSASLRALQTVGAAAFLALGAAAVVVGAASISAASDFEAAMLRVKTQAGASQAEVDSMTQAILRMATGLGTSPNALADALFRIESTGIRGADALKLLEAAAMGAKVGNADLTAVTMGLLAMVNSHIEGVGSQTQAMGILNAMVGVSNVTMEEMAHALGTGVLPAARAVGISIQDVGAAMGVLTSTGLPAEVAANRLRVTLSLMAAPTDEAAKALYEIGLTSDELARTMREQGLIPALSLLKTSLENSGLTAEQQAQIIRRAFGGGEMASTIQTLLGNFDMLVEKEGQLGAGADDFEQAWEDTKKTFAFQMDQMSAAVKVLSIEIGLVLIPIVQKMALALADAVTWLKEHKEVAIALGAVIGGVLLAAMTAFVAGLIAANAVVIAVGAGLGAFAVGFGLLYEKIGLAASAVLILLSPLAVLAAGVKLAYDNFGPFHDAVDATWQVLQVLWDAVQAAAAALMEFGRDAIPVVVNAFNTVVSAVQTVVAALMEFGRDALPVVADALAVIGDVFRDFLNGPIADLIGFFREIAPQIEEALGHIGAVVRTVFNDIATVIRTALVPISAVVEAVFGAIVSLIEDAIGIIGTVVRVNLAVISAFWNQWGDDIMRIIRNLVDGWESMFNAVFDAIGTVVENGIRYVRDVINLWLSIINGEWGNAWDAIKDMFDAVWDTIKGIVSAGFDFLFAVVSTGMQVVGNIFDGAWAAIWAGVQAGWDLILAFFRGLPGAILRDLSGLAGLLVDLGIKLIEGLGNGIVAGWNFVNSWFGGLPGQIVSLFAAAGSWLLDAGIKIIEGLGAGVVAAWNFVLAFFRDLGSGILGAVGDAGSWLVDTGIKIIEGLGRGAVAAWDFVSAWVRSLPGLFIGAIGDATTWLFNAGLDIIIGLLNGVAAAWELVPGFIRDRLPDFLDPLNAIEGLISRLNGAKIDITAESHGLDETSFALSMMADTLDRINQIPWWGGSGVPAGGFATGGVVPGPVGEPVMALLHGGERVMTRSQQRAQDMLASSPGTGVTGMGGPTSQSSTTQYIIQGDIVANDPAELERQLAARARLSNLTSAA